MKLVIIIFTIFTLVYTQNRCRNYNDIPGTCVAIDSCKTLKEIDDKLNKTYWDHLVINGNLCEAGGTIRKVCCVDNQSGLESKDRAPFGGINTPINTPDSIASTNPKPSTTTSTSTTTETAITGGDNSEVIKGSNTVLPVPGASNCGMHSADKIHGGNVAALDEHPWMARLQYNNSDGTRSFRCGGVLISSWYILTAAHCLTQPSDDLVLTRVRLGEWNAATNEDCFRNFCTDPPQDITIDRSIPHPDYVFGNTNYYNDIALLRLAAPARLTTFVRPLCLPSSSDLRTATNFTARKFEAVGWGETEQGIASDIKLKVYLTGVEHVACNYVWRHKNSPITDKQICAGGEQGKDTCAGDSGGPLVLPYNDGAGTNYHYVAGIVSYGLKECGKYNWPGVYTNVAAYMDWIEDNVKK